MRESSISSSPLDVLPDEHLVTRTLDGHQDAFNHLVRRHEQRLFRFLSRTGRCAADVEDAMQQAFVKAFRNLRGYNPKWRFTTWLFTIAVRELHSLGRRHPAIRTTTLDERNHPAAAAAPADADPGDLWASAKRLLNAQQYTALWLRYGEDLPVRDIARVMSRPRVWVSVTLHRACATLRDTAAPSRAGALGRDRGSKRDSLASTAGGVS
ncbi:MAG TPA: sigma-70 family RNA polymerase sigma factor [Tepidisphaeraceae bacterium]|jgi:RNA polymerase sigma-70 factor (ECF subfamily)